jgi:rhodanese-related sulfurtransferase
MKYISIQELQAVLETKERGNIVVIDVRTPEEYAAACIPGVVSMPLPEIAKHLEELKRYDTVYVHCQSGNRSQRACSSFEALGLENTINVTGGLNEWAKLGFEIIRGR